MTNDDDHEPSPPDPAGMVLEQGQQQGVEKGEEGDTQLYVYTSLTSGTTGLISKTSRLEVMLKAHNIHFKVIDVADDEAARNLWRGMAADTQKLPGLVKGGRLIGDFEDVELANDSGELKELVLR